MNALLKLNKIRPMDKVDKKQKVSSVIFSFLLGLTSGVIAKILDSTFFPNELSVLGLIGSSLGIWIFILTLVAVFSHTPKLASIRVFVFLIAMLFSYYLYTFFILNLFPIKFIIFWSVAAILSMIPAYIIWFSRTETLLSSFIIALPISVIAWEGYKYYLATVDFYEKYLNMENVLVRDGGYNEMLGFSISYSLMIIILLILLPKRKKQWLSILPFSVGLFFVLLAVLP